MKKEMQALFSEAKNQVVEAFPSVYSKEDVAQILNHLEEKLSRIQEPSASPNITPDFIEKLVTKVTEAIEYTAGRFDGDEVVEFYSAEFELNGNEISLSDIDVNSDNISTSICEDVEETIRDYFTSNSAPAEDVLDTPYAVEM